MRSKEEVDLLASQVKIIVDDRFQVIKAWRELGLTVFQVAEGDF